MIKEELLLDWWKNRNLPAWVTQLGSSYDQLYDAPRDIRGDERYTALTSDLEALRLDAVVNLQINK